ncbi:MAG: D-glycero-beta-D-manno-heptose-7-phosphate kinase [Spirochaetes bacterium]|nr:D-glycero-beta-D-manno-heptose-7-phosphate kinase [Spirochaetota bacterium]
MNLDFLNSRVLVIGDVILDKYYYGKVSRISPEAPVPVIKVIKEIHSPGGSGNVVCNICGLGAKAFHISLTGKDVNAKILKQVLNHPNAENKYFLSGKPTVTKIRVIGEHQQVARLDFEEIHETSKVIENKIMSAFNIALNKCDAVVISDYGKGLCSTDMCQFVIKESNKKNIPVIVDPKGYDWNKYKNASVITPNIKELGEAAGREIRNEDNEIAKYGREVMNTYSLKNLLVTRSDRGMTIITKDSICHIPTRAIEVFDVSGAGDTVVAALAVGLAGRLTITESADIANRSAGIVVGKSGTASIEIDELIQSFHDGSKLKILPLKSLYDIIKNSKNKRETIRIIAIKDTEVKLKTVNLIKKAKQNTEILIAAIIENNSPKENINEMSGIFANLECVDYVAVLDEKTLADVNKRISYK